MNKIILCEGGTDAILLSYYLGKVAGWSFCRKPPANISIKPDAFEQSINWYARGDDRLLICGVGGKDNMAVFFKNKILRPIVDADAFSRMAVVLDRAKDETGAIEDRASSTFRPIITAMKAHLGVTWAVQYPEKVFKLMNEQIESVKWEKSEVLHSCFRELEKI